MSLRDDIRRAIELAPRHPVRTSENQADAVVALVADWLLGEARQKEGMILQSDCRPEWMPELRFAANTLRWLAGKLKPAAVEPMPGVAPASTPEGAR